MSMAVSALALVPMPLPVCTVGRVGMDCVTETGVAYTVCSLSVLAIEGVYPALPLPVTFTDDVLLFSRSLEGGKADMDGVEGVSNGSWLSRAR